MFIPQQSLIPWKVIVTFLQIFAMFATSWRLWFRYNRRRLWVDDYTVIPALVMDMLNTLAIWFVWVETETNAQLERQQALTWLVSIPWYSLIWSTRISMALTITRIYPAWGTIRRCARTAALAFAILYVGVMAWQFTTSCSSVNDSFAAPTFILFSDCNSERYSLTIIEFIFDIGASLFLVAFPIVVLTNVMITRGQKLLTIAFLLSSLFCFLCTSLYCAFTYSPSISGPGRELVVSMLSELETVVSLLACNTVAVVTFLYRNDLRPGAIDDSIEWKKSNHVHHKEAKRPSSTTSFALKSITSNTPASPIQSDWLPQQTFAKSVHIEEAVL
ncbi:hypothetical protein CVT26_001010 [Gymnopilus dilepis]|uniref:G-protein coupled receptors family 1 profile domain-containing protein n=1 Tax=Gymnopilus dilepis TaxID=231916 RepID=A0A409Y271_9AGAR|nr:hypothetical protein CVT26_001010 [Gymnopilus dilepis]